MRGGKKTTNRKKCRREADVRISTTRMLKQPVLIKPQLQKVEETAAGEEETWSKF